MMTRSIVLCLLVSACQEGALEGALVQPLGSPPLVHIATQNSFYTHSYTCDARVRTDVSSVSGTFFLQDACDPCTTGDTDSATYKAFIRATEAEVECRIGQFLHNSTYYDTQVRPNCTGCACYYAPNVTGTIILDIEHPHLKDLWDYEGHETEIVDAYITRIRAAHRAFPNAKLGLYGTLNPDEIGDPADATFVKRKAALMNARTLGLYDQLDYLVPVLYPRFGCNREGATTCTEPPVADACDPKWIVDGEVTLGRYTELGITASRDLAPNKQLLPLFTVRIANSNSCFTGTQLLDLFPSLTPAERFDKTLQLQLDVLQAHNVGDAALWIGEDDNNLKAPNAGGLRVGNYTNQLCN